MKPFLFPVSILQSEILFRAFVPSPFCLLLVFLPGSFLSSLLNVRGQALPADISTTAFKISLVALIDFSSFLPAFSPGVVTALHSLIHLFPQAFFFFLLLLLQTPQKKKAK